MEESHSHQKCRQHVQILSQHHKRPASDRADCPRDVKDAHRRRSPLRKNLRHPQVSARQRQPKSVTVQRRSRKPGMSIPQRQRRYAKRDESESDRKRTPVERQPASCPQNCVVKKSPARSSLSDQRLIRIGRIGPSSTVTIPADTKATWITKFARPWCRVGFREEFAILGLPPTLKTVANQPGRSYAVRL